MNDAELLTNFVTTSTKDKAMMEEFARITLEYEEMAKQLEASGIPQRRAEIVFELIHAQTPRRTYAQVGQLLNLSIPRVGQILKAGRRRRAARSNTPAEAQDAA